MMNLVQRIPTVNLDGTGLVLRSVTVPTGSKNSAPYLLEIEPDTETKCPRCQQIIALKLSAPREYADVPWGLHPVKWRVTSGRGYCRNCKRETVVGLPEGTTIRKCATQELGQYLLQLMGTAPLRTLGERVGLSHNQVHQIQKALLSVSSSSSDHITHLGLDELYMLKQKHLIAIDMQQGKILKLASVGPVQESRADLVDISEFFIDLPEAAVVTVDMHQEQLRAVRRRWPEATIIIDQRHLLQVVDRDLITLAARVITGRWDDTADTLLPAKATRAFGQMAYPFLYLRSLILRRQRNLTPADHAAWMLLRAEGGDAQVLYDAYLWREALYDLYDPRHSEDAMALGLERWIEGVLAWQEPFRERSERAAALPLGRSVWLVRQHRAEVLNYARHPVTNALTERINARIRKLLRAGHRYSSQTLVDLINRELEPEAGNRRVMQPTMWLPAGKVVVEAPPPETPALATPPAPQTQTLPIPVDFDYQHLPLPVPNSPSLPRLPVARIRKPRHLPRCAPELGIPEDVWIWVHTKQSRQLGSPTWVNQLMEYAPPSDFAAWRILCSGRVSGVGTPVIGGPQIELWRATVLWLYVQCHLEQLNARERERQPLLAELDLPTLARVRPEIISQLCTAWLSIVVTFASLPPELEGLMVTVINWQRLSVPAGQATVQALRTGKQGDRSIWDSWCSAAVGQVELMPLVARWRRRLNEPDPELVAQLMQQPELRWLTAVEWAAIQSAKVAAPPALQRLAAFKLATSLLDEH